MRHDEIMERWKWHYDKMLNEENPRAVFGDGVPNEGLTPDIKIEEVDVILKRMKNGKAMGPDNCSGGLQERGRRSGRYVVGSVTEDFRAGENA